MKKPYYICFIFIFLATGLAAAQVPVSGENKPVIRGKKLSIFVFPASHTSQGHTCKVLYASGDGGMTGHAASMAQGISSLGYEVFGLDVKQYLISFTGKTTLTETQVISDFRDIAQWMTQGYKDRVILVGWSEGAGLCLLAASSPNKAQFSGLITIGLPDSCFLGWRLIDNKTYLTKKNPDEPSFSSDLFISKVYPLPLYMVQSTQDDYVSVDSTNRMFSLAREPKKIKIIDARNHRFDGNKDDFFKSLLEGLKWIERTTP